jgi:hypothetical protein
VSQPRDPFTVDDPRERQRYVEALALVAELGPVVADVVAVEMRRRGYAAHEVPQALRELRAAGYVTHASDGWRATAKEPPST